MVSKVMFSSAKRRGARGSANRGYIHGLNRKGPWKTWVKMRERCLSPKNASYRWYGARGISICKEWMEFPAFYHWALANGWQKGLTLERIDNNGNYCPSNCTWIPQSEQSQNTRRTRRFLLKTGEAITWKECIRRYNRHGLAPSIIKQRLNSYGWTLWQALTLPKGSRVRASKPKKRIFEKEQRIKAMLLAGHGYVAIAQELKTSPATICKMKKELGMPVARRVRHGK